MCPPYWSNYELSTLRSSSVQMLQIAMKNVYTTKKNIEEVLPFEISEIKSYKLSF